MTRAMFFLLVALTLTAPCGFCQVVGLTHGQPPHLPAPYIKPIVANLSRVSVSPGFKPQAGPSAFLTGFDSDAHGKSVNGPPVGVAVAKDGSLLVSDDGGRDIWRVSESQKV
ncbi:MAG: hypothetical protein ACRD3T_21980 [Terriglobia bacterium]